MWIKFFSLLKLSLKKKKASFSIGAPTFDYKYELSLEEPATNVIIGIGGDANQHLIPRIHPSSPPPPFQVLHSFHTSLEGTAHFTYKCCTLELDQVLFLLSFFYVVLRLLDFGIFIIITLREIVLVKWEWRGESVKLANTPPIFHSFKWQLKNGMRRG